MAQTAETNKTTQVVREAMRIVSKEVRAPKVVREGVVTPIKEKK
ncbi:MAG: hypothetical protein ACT4ON_07105 [Bacteroidota bacterium]